MHTQTPLNKLVKALNKRKWTEINHLANEK